MRTKLFFDTEFTGLHQGTTLISLGIVSEDGVGFYAELTDYDLEQVDKWIAENVISRLQLQAERPPFFDQQENNCLLKGNKAWVKKHLLEFLKPYEAVEMWSDNLAYDWVLFCQLFGHALKLPKSIYYIPFDLSTLLHLKGIDPDITREEFVAEELIESGGNNKHNALWDAHVVQLCYQKAMRL